MAKTEHFVFSIFMKIDTRNFVVMTNIIRKSVEEDNEDDNDNNFEGNLTQIYFIFF